MVKGQINGLRMHECNDFIQDLNNIEGVKSGIYLQEGLVEFKSIFTPFVIEIAKGVSMGLVVAAILKFFEKNKDKKRISIVINNVIINNKDDSKAITEKIDKAFF